MEKSFIVRSQSLVNFLDNYQDFNVKEGEKCSATLIVVENHLNYLDTIKHDLLVGMSNTFELILDYFTSVQDKCNSIKMKTRCMKVMVSKSTIII